MFNFNKHLWAIRTASALGFVTSLLPICTSSAFAHGAVVAPIAFHHAAVTKVIVPTSFHAATVSLTNRSLAAFLSKGGNSYFLQNYFGSRSGLRSIGSLTLASGAARILQRNKSIVENGVSLGKSVFPPLTSASITNGQLTGALYFQAAGGFQGNGYPTYIAVGSNPLNSPNTIGSYTTFPTGSNFLNLSGSSGSVITKSVNGKLLAFAGAKPPELSGAQRALFKETSLLSGKAIALGEKANPLFNGGPVAGGEFVGTGYFFSPGGYLSFGKILYAFGNDPLNKVGVASNFGGPSFIDFTNGTVKTISSGELYGLGFFAPSRSTQSIFFALGKDAFNTGSLGELTNPALFKSLFFF